MRSIVLVLCLSAIAAGQGTVFHKPGSTPGPVPSTVITPIVNGGTGANTAAAARSNLGVVSLTGSYVNPTWITSLDWSKITGVPALGGGGGISSLNGLSGPSQTFAIPGTTGTAPNWVSSGTAHTLHIPLASAAGVTAGLIPYMFYNSIITSATSPSTGDLTGTFPNLSIGSGKVTNAHLGGSITADKMLHLTGSGTYFAVASAAPADGCATWSTGIIGSTGTACGAGGGSMVYPAAGIPQSVGGASWGSSLGLVTSVGSPGVDTNVPSEKAVASAIAAKASKLTATFLLCAGPCVALETSNWRWTAPFAVSVTGCIVDAQTYPTGAAITVDVLKAGATTLFTSTVPTLAAGSSAYNEQTGMAAAATLAKGDYLIAKALTVGSTVAGQFVNVVCTATY